MPGRTGLCQTRFQTRSDPTGVKDSPDLDVQDFRCVEDRTPDAGVVPGRNCAVVPSDSLASHTQGGVSGRRFQIPCSRRMATPATGTPHLN